MIFELMTITEIVSDLCLLIGSFLCISGGLGILRFPDFYTRMHAVGVTDTLAAAMILIGLMLQGPDSLVVIKLLMILLMTLFINPTASNSPALQRNSTSSRMCLSCLMQQ
ncbi:monovalent cation/H(+) antiporter subunit G [bacterium]|nr:monovalent cation/H(+) antiporter subunit G [bacterium]